MLPRRSLLLALVTALVAAGPSVLGCSRPKESAPKPAAPAWPRTVTHAGVSFIELFPSGADESSPVVVAIHGRGDAPANWVDTWSRFPGRARIALPRAPIPFGEGYSWFALREGMTDAELGAAVGEAEASLWPAIQALAGGRRLLVTGFSQGGILSFALAARHGAAIAHAFPVAGSCPGPLLPKPNEPAAPLTAFHGSDDDVIAHRWGQAAVSAFVERGNEASLRTYPGVGHALPSAMRDDVWRAIVSALDAPRDGG